MSARVFPNNVSTIEGLNAAVVCKECGRVTGLNLIKSLGPKVANEELAKAIGRHQDKSGHVEVFAMVGNEDQEKRAVGLYGVGVGLLVNVVMLG